MPAKQKSQHGGARPGAGRPRVDEPRTVLQIRTTPEWRAQWQQAADAAGMTLSAWVRDTLNTAASRTR